MTVAVCITLAVVYLLGAVALLGGGLSLKVGFRNTIAVAVLWPVYAVRVFVKGFKEIFRRG